MKSDRRLELSVGLFLGFGLLLALLGIWTLGSQHQLLGRSDLFFVRLARVNGITPGSRVTLSGMNAGSVESFALDPVSRDVRVGLRLSKAVESDLRGDSYA